MVLNLPPLGLPVSAPTGGWGAFGSWQGSRASCRCNVPAHRPSSSFYLPPCRDLGNNSLSGDASWLLLPLLWPRLRLLPLQLLHAAR